MSIISTSLTVRAQPSPRFHVEVWITVKWTILILFSKETALKASVNCIPLWHP